MRSIRFWVLAAITVAVLSGNEAIAGGLPPSGTDILPVVVEANVRSRLGTETVVLTGWVEIERGAPYQDGGVNVVDVEVVAASLQGASSVGMITATERANVGQQYVSSGQIRSLQAGNDFPASSFFDVYLDVTIPIQGGSAVVHHNEWPIRLTPRVAGVSVGGAPLTPAPAIPVGVVGGGGAVTLSDLAQQVTHHRCYQRTLSGGAITCETSISQWPPLGVTYDMFPVYGVNNDGDAQVDEDTPDDDGDILVDEDRPGADPDTPGSGSECGINPDCDAFEGEDPPLSWCATNDSAICQDDSDNLQDEDPACVPLVNSAGVNSMKAGVCIRELSLDFAPALPSFSVGRDGPSDLHPADILGLSNSGGPGGGPTPLTLVGCNDDSGGLQSEVTFSASAGVTYQIQVGSFSGSVGGDLTLNAFTVPGSPAPTVVSGNDNFANRWTIGALPFQGQQSTTAATTEPNEPFNCDMGARTVWYRYTPSSNQTVTVNTFNSDFDTVLAVYTGDALSTAPLGTFPFVRIACADLGLTTNGCDTTAPVDNVNALSYGNDLPPGAPPGYFFSVGAGAQGRTSSAVRAQRNCPSPEPEPDLFYSAINLTNTLQFDGNGPVGTCTSAFPLGLVEGASQRDNVDALDMQDPSVVDTNGDGVPNLPVYFSLDATSPSLGTFGFTAGDVLRTVNGATPTVFAARATLGLVAGDSIDAVCLRESGNGVYGGGDQLYFSLAPGSPTLTTIGASASDVLAPGSPPTVAQQAASLGLLSSDDLDALACDALGEDPPVGVDTDGDGCTDEQEQGATPAFGGQRDPSVFWDFFDTPDPSGNRDKAISVGDVFRVVARFGTSQVPPLSKEAALAQALTVPPPTGYHAGYDRSPTSNPSAPWASGPPDGSIAVNDILFSVVQFGHTCA